jgi:chromate transporter
MRDDLVLALLAVFVPFSLVSIGGGMSVMAGIQHQAVDVRHWLTGPEFIEAFAIARASPGPGTMIAPLIGWHVAGWPGALIATLAFYLPSTLLCYGVVRVWGRYRGKPWHTALEQGLAPIGIGLILAGAVSILRIGGGGLLGWAVAIGSGSVLMLRPRLHPVVLFVAGAAVFVAVHAAAGW